MKPFYKFPLAALAFCTTLAVAAPTYAEPPNLSCVKNELKKYHDSGRYEKDLAQVVEKAKHYINQQARLNKKRKNPKNLAIVLDIDETSLSNYKYMIKRDFSGTRADFHQDVMAANSPAIKPMLSLYKDAVNRGVNVFFVTGRRKPEANATAKNLHRAGYHRWAGLYLRPSDYAEKSIIPFKANTRKLITQKGYTIIATIGDQYSDIKGGYAEKGFKLPNPYYYLP
ncbi:HAD family acid phosphatase [Legionella saoudiensis]|uniref:HAD family acid phosphatase n=1 Tax=Legionella saoudiensis TaxID=1750561 RepID=UPI000731B556|nr:HAD family acid phosphatase [Legionella saoudiensis]